MSEQLRILVVRTDRIGDVVLSTPLIRALRKSFPLAFIAAMVRPYAREVLLGNPHLNEVLLDDPIGKHAGRAGFWSQVKALSRYNFDAAVVLLPKSRLTWMLFMAGIRKRVSVEVRLDHLLTLTKTVTRNKYVPLRHEADYCLDLGRAIGASDDGLAVEVFLSEEERASARETLETLGMKKGKRLVGIHPGSGKSSPNWRVERYAELAKFLLKDRGIQVVLTGSPDEAKLATAFSGLDRDRMINTMGNTIRDMMGVISHLDVLVSSSTGAMHIAAGLRVPTVSLFCPLPACSPQRWGPLGNYAEIVLPNENFCQKQCPGDPHRCEFEDGILPETVLTAVNRVLQRRLS